MNGRVDSYFATRYGNERVAEFWRTRRIMDQVRSERSSLCFSEQGPRRPGKIRSFDLYFTERE
jgi:hypothetical protein